MFLAPTADDDNGGVCLIKIMNLIGYGVGGAPDASRRRNKCVATLGVVYRLVRKWKVVGVKVNLNGLAVRRKLLPPPPGEPPRNRYSRAQYKGSVWNLLNLVCTVGFGIKVRLG